MPSLAQIREQYSREFSKFPRIPERAKFENLMRAVGYVETDEAKEALSYLKNRAKVDGPEDVGGYFCYTCEYFKTKFNSPTGFECQEWKFPDDQHGCCNSWKKK